MPQENTTEGISTTELCVESKKYLSRLLVGKTGIKPDYLTWDLLLSEKLTLDTFVETGLENLEQLMQARAEWNQLLKEIKLKNFIENKLVQLECRNCRQEYLKFSEQQTALHYKKRGLIAIGLIVALAIAYSFVLPLLSIATTFIGISCLTVGVSLVCCSIVPAFVGEKLIDPKWEIAYAAVEKENRQQIIQKIKGSTTTEIIAEETKRSVDTPPTLLSDTHIHKKNSLCYRLFKSKEDTTKSNARSKQRSILLCR
ncbi:MAG: hypothetical protein WAL30_04005 [Candidatus Aquirickettsiella sp.]